MFSKKYFVFLLIILSLFSVSADILSINSGGDGAYVINTDNIIEGFFFNTPSSSNPIFEGGGGLPLSFAGKNMTIPAQIVKKIKIGFFIFLGLLMLLIVIIILLHSKLKERILSTKKKEDDFAV